MIKRAFILALAFAATVSTAQDTNFAVRISCDFQQQAGAAELPDLTLLQGSAPMIQAAPMRMGRAVSADSLTTCQLVFGPSATSTYYVATNAYLATNSAYYIQLGTIGTNSVPAGSNSPSAWWYSILFYRNGGIYWSGSGRLYIERTTATGANGLVWQEWEAGAAKDDIARGWIALLSNEVASIEVVGANYGTETNTAFRGDWGDAVSNLAAWSSNNFSNAWVRGESVTNAVDATARAGVASNAASIVAVGAVASNTYRIATNAQQVANGAVNTNESRNVKMRGFVSISDSSWRWRILSITNYGGNITSNWAGEYVQGWTGAGGTVAVHRTGGRYYFSAPNGIAYIGGTNMSDNVTNWVFVLTNGAWIDRNADPVFVTIETNANYAAGNKSLSINSDTPRTNLPYIGNKVGLHVSDRAIALEKPDGYYGSAKIIPALSAWGYDLRQDGRNVLWLNSAGYELGGTNYDFSADIFFGTGTNMTDETIKWAISSRPVVPRAYGHTYDQLAIFESEGAGDLGGTVKRLGITPDRGGSRGSIWLGRADLTDPEDENIVSNSTVAIVDRGGSASLRIVSDNDNGTTNRAVFSMEQGTNCYEMYFLDGEIYKMVNGIEYSEGASDGGTGISAAVATGIAQTVVANYTNTLPLPGCAILPVDQATSNAWITGTHEYYAITGNLTPVNLCISNTARRIGYQVTILSTQAVTLATNMVRIGAAWTPSGTNLVVIWPHCDGALWRVKGQAQ